MNETTEITTSELLAPKISVCRWDGRIFFFFGKATRAQLSVKMENPMELVPRELKVIQAKFPLGVVEYQ